MVCLCLRSGCSLEYDKRLSVAAAMKQIKNIYQHIFIIDFEFCCPQILIKTKFKFIYPENVETLDETSYYLLYYGFGYYYAQNAHEETAQF